MTEVSYGDQIHAYPVQRLFLASLLVLSAEKKQVLPSFVNIKA